MDNSSQHAKQTGYGAGPATTADGQPGTEARENIVAYDPTTIPEALLLERLNRLGAWIDFVRELRTHMTAVHADR